MAADPIEWSVELSGQVKFIVIALMTSIASFDLHTLALLDDLTPDEGLARPSPSVALLMICLFSVQQFVSKLFAKLFNYLVI